MDDQNPTTGTPPFSGDNAGSGDGSGINPAVGVGPYRLKRVIGVGGMGVVYEAAHERLGRPVAIKFIGKAAENPEVRRRFNQERDTLAALRHPSIAHIYDAGEAEHGGQTVPYIVMEYIVGARPITRGCRDGGLSLPKVIEIFESLFDALDHAHRRGIVHRDLKPGNILMDSEGKPKIIDFGLCLPTGARAAFDSLSAEGGHPVGTYKYMSPEQRSGDPLALDHRTDLYSLALVLLEILEDLYPEIPRSIAEVIDGALKSEPVRRTPSAAIIRDQLRACRDELVVHETVIGQAPGVSGRSTTPLLLAAVVSLISGAVSFFAMLPLLCGVFPICDRYGSFLEGFATSRDRPYEHVAVVMIDDDTLADPAFGAGDVPITLRQLRPFFDDLIDRLIVVDPASIVFDLQVPRVPGYDMEPLADSFRDAREAGIPVIQMDRAWPDGSLNSDVDPVFFGASTIIASGAAICGADAWRSILAARPRNEALLPTIGLAAFAMRDLPTGTLALEGNLENEMLSVRRFQSSEGGSKVPIGDPFDVPVTLWSRAGEKADQSGLKVDDQTAVFAIGIPNDDLLDAATISFRDVMGLGDRALREYVGDKAVIVAADCAGSYEIAPYPDGRFIAKAYAHAETIESLYDRASIQQIADVPTRFYSAGAAFLGVGIAFAGTMSVLRRLLITLIAVIAVCLAGLVFASVGMIVLTPPIAGGVVVGSGIGLLFASASKFPR